MNACDFFVLPSLSEGVSFVAKEAAACQLPVVASDIGAIPELVVDNKTGLLVKPENSASLVEAISLLIEKPQLRKEMGLEARRLVEKKFSWPVQAKLVASFYKEAIDMHKTLF